MSHKALRSEFHGLTGLLRDAAGRIEHLRIQHEGAVAARDRQIEELKAGSPVEVRVLRKEHERALKLAQDFCAERDEARRQRNESNVLLVEASQIMRELLAQKTVGEKRIKDLVRKIGDRLNDGTYRDPSIADVVPARLSEAA